MSFKELEFPRKSKNGPANQHETTTTMHQNATTSDLEALAELDTELRIRANVFEKWISSGKMNRTDAQRRYNALATARLLVSDLCRKNAADEHQPQDQDVPKP